MVWKGSDTVRVCLADVYALSSPPKEEALGSAAADFRDRTIKAASRSLLREGLNRPEEQSQSFFYTHTVL